MIFCFWGLSFMNLLKARLLENAQKTISRTILSKGAKTIPASKLKCIIEKCFNKGRHTVLGYFPNHRNWKKWKFWNGLD